MVVIIRNFLTLAANFINTLFELQIEWEPGQYIGIGKVVVAFIFIVLTFYMFFDAFGLNE